ncbi:hypothetical protein BL253_03860 [Pseudofrankia asymbiotica]|uniref:Uncharacterized protein n=1 Tax=Pseudofrankia asymbiotica TaxID=1834516 RepID=A0A1V2IKH7_9ACTN|nr:hypothetical protein BL253_03860 [Pseudofrankia asymbiotica]
MPVSLVAAGRATGRPAALAEGPADVLHLRLEPDDAVAGVSLGQARALFAGVARLLQAAAMAAIGPASRFAGRRPDAVKAFVEQDVRFVHAEADSPLLAVYTRLDDGPPPGADPARGATAPGAASAVGVAGLAPFQRRVGTTLAGALVEVTEAIRDHPTARRLPFAEPADDPAGPLTEPATATGPADGTATETAPSPLVLRGVSVDLCDALLGMVTAPRVRRMELAFYWAPHTGLDTPAVVRVALRRDDVEALLRLRAALAALSERPRTAVYGQVTRLDRGEADDGGIATIRGVVGRSTPRTVQVAVSGPEYDDAIRAYRTREPVVATGRLRRHGGVHVLTGTFTVTRDGP